MAEETPKKRGKGNENSGRKFDQKMKSILVYLYLLQKTDSDHFETGEAIAEYLQENFGISAERRSVYRDIQEINKALLAHREGITLEEAEEMLEEDESEKIIQYQNRKASTLQSGSMRKKISVCLPSAFIPQNLSPKSSHANCLISLLNLLVNINQKSCGMMLL